MLCGGQKGSEQAVSGGHATAQHKSNDERQARVMLDLPVSRILGLLENLVNH